ncbi:ATP-binding cassette domain-containing protein [Robiginitalea aurantiaca]|uniref:ATP-binding cassette domain-containing protein n=1 Tax=Robiginitalea aurantiaca TaxID=3056915 RepID=A0ABT7WFR9_9FLAO|nr:ATP-binding cassette domain-containing protein [Robiginitalea aurantiaca]MDM9631761.1 ATP-binding cassette domain-containing protein [Robiginitalea aurantiaca]
MSVLHVDSIRKRYKDKIILSDVYLKCQTGEIAGVMGRNGSGKSTLFKIIFKTVSADSRFVKVDHKVLRGSAETRKEINYLPEYGFLPHHVRIRDAFELYLGRALPAGLKEDAFLLPLLQKKAVQMSVGERRYVEILLTLYSEAGFVLLDEPFKGLAPLIRDQIVHHLRLVQPGKGILISDHDAGRICEISDSLMLLKNGFLKKLRDRAELITLGYLPRESKSTNQSIV